MKRPNKLSTWMKPRSRSIFGDLDVPTLAPLRTYMNQLQSAISNNDSTTAQLALFNIVKLSGDLSTRSDAAGQTQAILGTMSAEGNEICNFCYTGGSQPGGSPLPISALTSNAGAPNDNATKLRRIYGNINLLVKADISAGAITYLTVVDPAISMTNLSNLLGRLNTLKQKIGTLQPGGAWNPADALMATSAEQVTPLQDELQQILTSANNIPLTDTDKTTFQVTSKEVGNFLAGKEVEANRAGAALAKAINTVNAGSCAGKKGDALTACCNSAGESGADQADCIGTNLAADCFSKTNSPDDLAACCAAAAAGGGSRGVEQCKAVSTTINNLASCSTYLPDFACSALAFIKNYWIIFAIGGGLTGTIIGYFLLRGYLKVSTFGVLKSKKRSK